MSVYAETLLLHSTQSSLVQLCPCGLQSTRDMRRDVHDCGERGIGGRISLDLGGIGAFEGKGQNCFWSMMRRRKRSLIEVCFLLRLQFAKSDRVFPFAAKSRYQWNCAWARFLKRCGINPSGYLEISSTKQRHRICQKHKSTHAAPVVMVIEMWTVTVRFQLHGGRK